MVAITCTANLLNIFVQHGTLYKLLSPISLPKSSERFFKETVLLFLLLLFEAYYSGFAAFENTTLHRKVFLMCTFILVQESEETSHTESITCTCSL